MDPQTRQWADAAAAKYGVPASLVKAVIRAESGGNQAARSPVGAIGDMQLMPSTAKGLGVDPYDERQNIEGGTKYLSQLLRQFGGDTKLAVAGYNAGGGAARKAITAYPETRAYVSRVMNYMRDSGGAAAPPSLGATSATPADATPGGYTPGQKWALNYFAKRTSSDSLRSRLTDMATIAPLPTADTPMPATSSVVSHGSGPGSNYKQIEAWANALTGANIPHTPEQETQGKHAKGSLHYAKKAADFGDATTSHAQLMELASYARQHPQEFKEFFYNPLGWGIKNGRIVKGLTVAGHDDHLHVGVF